MSTATDAPDATIAARRPRGRPRKAVTLPLPPVQTSALTVEEAATVEAAKYILQSRLQRAHGSALHSSFQVRELAQLRMGALDHERFAVMFLDASHRLIAFDEMFIGTLTTATVYPREVVKRALAHNAAAVILCHNHPSGNVVPSPADKFLTCRLTQVLELVDVKVLDHIVVGQTATLSFVEQGLMRAVT
jgi:DNA repair protein RadC